MSKAYDEHPNIAQIYNNMGLAYEALGKAQVALEFYEKALQIWIKSFENDHPYILECSKNIANIKN